MMSVMMNHLTVDGHTEREGPENENTVAYNDGVAKIIECMHGAVEVGILPASSTARHYV